ncbi:hypothetical protein PHSY_003666 [Pseudozyma hubeiensis SY62]|uniref:Uncharacterized protein n=1 Tax=Pseudozyma hubeiensis (strain SY62) TaxID=1305764 RepID=R9P4A6_PSEHS|nr:hypothetical protein PHSY_003666 [Pseudozyma hubeiensis SY62]GAC96087.1 hypothetical protein PHSY_003666 [Pseudozyma hubeiensis SY62]
MLDRYRLSSVHRLAPHLPAVQKRESVDDPVESINQSTITILATTVESIFSIVRHQSRGMAASTRRVAALAWHAIALSSCIYGFKSLDVLPEILGVDMNNEYGGALQFLTMCGLSVTTAAMSLALLLDITQGPEVLRWMKDLFMAASLPMETLITLLYWSIVAINKDLLMQPRKIMDPANPGQVLREESVSVPFSIDASMHAFPGVFLLVDFFAFSRPLPKSIPIVAVAGSVTVGYTRNIVPRRTSSRSTSGPNQRARHEGERQEDELMSVVPLRLRTHPMPCSVS